MLVTTCDVYTETTVIHYSNGVVEFVERRASNRKLRSFPPWGQAVYLLWWPSLTKDMQTEQLLSVLK